MFDKGFKIIQKIKKKFFPFYKNNELEFVFNKLQEGFPSDTIVARFVGGHRGVLCAGSVSTCCRSRYVFWFCVKRELCLLPTFVTHVCGWLLSSSCTSCWGLLYRSRSAKSTSTCPVAAALRLPLSGYHASFDSAWLPRFACLAIGDARASPSVLRLLSPPVDAFGVEEVVSTCKTGRHKGSKRELYTGEGGWFYSSSWRGVSSSSLTLGRKALSMALMCFKVHAKAFL